MPDTLTNPEWWPTVERVAALLRARTLESGRAGTYVQTFTDQTRPTRGQVEAFIAEAASELSGEASGRVPCTTSLEGRSATFIVYRAASLAEGSIRPEASQEGTTLASQLRKIADSKLESLVQALEDRCPLPTDEASHIRSRGPVRRGWTGPTIGRRTVW